MIYVLLAQGFEEIEALATVDILRRAELEVGMVGVGGKTVTGAHGIPVVCDLTAEEADTAGLEMLVLPGGMPGTLNLEKSGEADRLISYTVANDLWLAAICAAPSVLGHKRLLEGRRVTCFPGFETQLGGAVATGERVVRDAKLITAKGPGAAIEFALCLVETLRGRERMQKLKDSLQ